MVCLNQSKLLPRVQAGHRGQKLLPKSAFCPLCPERILWTNICPLPPKRIFWIQIRKYHCLRIFKQKNKLIDDFNGLAAIQQDDDAQELMLRDGLEQLMLESPWDGDDSHENDLQIGEG